MVLLNCELTDTFWERICGLIGRSSLQANEGLLIRPCNSIHNFFMQFSIDVVFLNKNNSIIALYHSLKPWRLTWIHWRANSVLELPAGRIKALKLKQGDNLELCPSN